MGGSTSACPHDLDNLYGRGPADQPYMHEPDGIHFALAL
jgi:hypothetical protein